MNNNWKKVWVLLLALLMLAGLTPSAMALEPGGGGGGTDLNPGGGVIIPKTENSWTERPTAIGNLVADGSAQALITGGTPAGGTAKYYATTDSSFVANTWQTCEDDPAYSDILFTNDIPTGTEAGTYYVWYAADGGDLYNDIAPDYLTVTIVNDPVSYLVPVFDQTSGALTGFEGASVTDYTVVTNSGEGAWPVWGDEENQETEMWYVVKEDATIEEYVGLEGDVNLILCDGAKLTVNKGIYNNLRLTFTIYAQSTDADTMGSLTSSGYINYGNVTINGGNVTAKNVYYSDSIAASCYLTINGGIVNAEGTDNHAALASYKAQNIGAVTINGGKVTAIGGISGDVVIADGANVTAGADADSAGPVTNFTAWDHNENWIYIEKMLTVPVTDVTLSPATATLTADGDAVALTATVVPENATDRTVVWSVATEASEDVVKLYSDADCTAENEIGDEATDFLTVYARGVSAGAATVTAASSADDTVSASCEVTVYAADVHNDISFAAWDSATSLPTAAGSYYLTEDVTLGVTWAVPEGTTNLCLNGHDITYYNEDEYDTVIYVASGATLNLYDDSENPGAITGGRGYLTDDTYRLGGGVYVDGGALNLYGGRITGNTADYGGGVYVTGQNGAVSLQGNVEISGNTGGDIDIGNDSLIAIGGELTKIATIGVGIVGEDPDTRDFGYVSGVITSGWTTAMGDTANPADYFTSNIEKYSVFLSEEGEALLVSPVTVSYDLNGGTGGSAPTVTEYAPGATVTVPDMPDGVTFDGFSFVGWDTMADGTGDRYSPDGTFTIAENTTLYAIWAFIYKDIEFLAWTGTDSLPEEAGSYCLTGDVTLTGANQGWAASEGTTNLYLNGHSITYESSGKPALYVEDCELNLYDENTGDDAGTITGTGGIGIRVAGTGSVNMYGGRITGSQNGVQVYNSGSTFALYDGMITGNSNHGVYIMAGTFILGSGSITNNTQNGVYVCDGSTFRLSGTDIAPQITGNGYGVFLEGTTIGVDDGTTLSSDARIPVRLMTNRDVLTTGTIITGLTVPEGVLTSENGAGFAIVLVDNGANMVVAYTVT